MTKDSTAAKTHAELSRSTKSRDRKLRRYVAPKKGRDWYEKAEGQVAITQNAAGTPLGRR